MNKGESKQIFSGAMLSFGMPNSFYFFKFYDNDIEFVNDEEITTIQEKPEKIIENKKSKMTEKKYLDKFNESAKDRSRLDIYKELLNKEKGYNFEIEGNKTLEMLKKKANKYKGKHDKKAKEKDWEISWGMVDEKGICLLYTSPSPRDLSTSRMPSSA